MKDLQAQPPLLRPQRVESRSAFFFPQLILLWFWPAGTSGILAVGEAVELQLRVADYGYGLRLRLQVQLRLRSENGAPVMHWLSDHRFHVQAKFLLVRIKMDKGKSQHINPSVITSFEQSRAR
jgi:hypothetical protein